MLDEERDLADIAVFDKQMLCQSDTGVEVEVAHGKRLLVDVPHALLRVEEKEIRVERKRTLRETLRDAHLEFHVAVGARRGLRSYRCAGDEIIVFVEREVRTVVKFAAQTVGVDLFLSKVNNLCVGSNG